MLKLAFRLHWIYQESSSAAQGVPRHQEGRARGSRDRRSVPRGINPSNQWVHSYILSHLMYIYISHNNVYILVIITTILCL